MALKQQNPNTQTPTKLAPANRISDVARPGNLPPADATTRPVIVTNRVVMQDPMMAPLQPNGLPTVDKTSPEADKLRVKTTIKPLAGQNDVAVASSTGTSAPQTSSTPDTTATHAAYTDATADQNNAEQDSEKSDIEPNDLDKQAVELEADAKAQDELDTLVDQKTYFLPINAVEQRRSRNVFVFGTIIIVMLALAWLDIAMDAGFITLPGIQPLTHIFRN